jgi:hypothetical protein
LRYPSLGIAAGAILEAILEVGVLKENFRFSAVGGARSSW